MTRSYQFQLVSLQGLLLLSWGLFTQFAPKNVPLWDSESISFLRGLIVVHSHVFYTCVLLSEQKNMGPSGIWKLQLKMSHTCGGPQFFSWCLGWFLLIFSWFQRKRLCVSGVPPINSNGISLLIRGFLSSEWNHMEFSFCLKTHSTLCMYTSDFDESDKKKSIKVLPCSIRTFNKCKKC